MNHEEKLGAIKDMLVANGRIGLIQDDERAYWASAIYYRQSEAIGSVSKWNQRPVVLAALLERWLQMDDGEGALEIAEDALMAALGEEGCVLAFSKASYPFREAQTRGLQQLLRYVERIPEFFPDHGLERAHEFARAVSFIYWGALHSWRLDGKCQVEESELASIAARLEKWPLPGEALMGQASGLFSVSRLLAVILWAQVSDREWRGPLQELYQWNASPRLLALAVMLGYIGPRYLESTADAARLMGVELPESDLPFDIPFESETLRVTHPIRVPPNEELGEILQKHLPGCKAWFDLVVPHQEFAPDDPAIYSFLENELKSNVQLQTVYAALEATQWPEFETN